jgi:hypothetical protein
VSLDGVVLDGLVLGAPGVYHAPHVPQPRAATEPMDVAAFVGVTPRGPAYEPVDDPSLVEAGVRFARSVAVPVGSWDEYLEAFGGFTGPGLLPHAVAAYFAQGGRRAYVVRIVARPDGGGPVDEPPGCTRYMLPGVTELRARNEGTWGDRLGLDVRFTARTLAAAVRPTRPGPGAELVLQPGSAVPVGTLLRLRTPGAGGVLAVVARVSRVGRSGAVGHDLVAAFDRTVVPPEPGDPGPVVELVEAELTVTDRDPERPRRERFTGLGMRPAHPRFLLDVLRRESRLVAPVVDGWAGFEPGPELTALSVGAPSKPGADRWSLLAEADIFGGGGELAGGIDVLSTSPEVATVVVPDLYAPLTAPVQPLVETVGGSARFRPCTPPRRRVEAGPSPGPSGLALDPTDPAGLREIVARQRRLVAVAERLGLVALLDVPPGLRAPQVPAWRAAFDSSCAAAYHPWLRAPGPDPGGPLVAVPPAAVAAGIIVRCELRSGISRGPANERASGVVDVAGPIDDATHDELHRLGVDVFRIRPDGVWLTGARTLSADPGLRQLTVRRLLFMVARAVRRQLAWSVFEPADDRLRAGLRRHLDQLLGDLFAAGAFAGATAEESWFVQVGEPDADGPGRLLVEVGMAPAEPLEFIVVRVAIDADGAIESGIDAGDAESVGAAAGVRRA